MISSIITIKNGIEYYNNQNGTDIKFYYGVSGQLKEYNSEYGGFVKVELAQQFPFFVANVLRYTVADLEDKRDVISLAMAYLDRPELQGLHTPQNQQFALDFTKFIDSYINSNGMARRGNLTFQPVEGYSILGTETQYLDATGVLSNAEYYTFSDCCIELYTKECC